jgi:hypothetical protein
VKRVLLAGSLLFILLPACTVVPEREALRLLPEDRGPLPYNELAVRARLQATGAMEAYYVDRWSDVEDAARGLEQTARFLAKAQDVPAKQKETLPKLSENLAKEAVLLRDSAKEKDAKKVHESLTRVQSLVRELTPPPSPDKEPKEP